MNSVEKTAALQRKNISVNLIDPTPDNPNEMTDQEFNMLADNMEEVGFVDPAFVRPKGDRFEMIGGNHRLEVAKILGYDEIPCTVITDPDFDDDRARFQVVRMNVIRGKISPQKFIKLYQQMQGKYAEEILAHSFGFADEDEFRKLVSQVAKSLPKEVQEDFKKAAAEVKTIDDLSKILNGLFNKFGDTLPFGYMLLDFGGKESIWLRMENPTRKACLELGKLCQKERRTMDDLIGGLVRMAAEGKLGPQLQELISTSKQVEVPEDVTLPTYEALQ